MKGFRNISEFFESIGYFCLFIIFFYAFHDGVSGLADSIRKMELPLFVLLFSILCFGISHLIKLFTGNHAPHH
jgi:hypothetical protein